MVKNKFGFTFVELLISISIIALFSSLILARYNQQTAYKKLDQDINKVIDILELAKKKAIAGDYASQTSCAFQGYNVSFSGSTYQLNLLCASTVQVSNYQLNSTVSFSPIPAAPIVFSPITGSNNTQQTIQLIESSLGVSKIATISVNYGVISKQ